MAAGERGAVDVSDAPRTRASLAADLRALGVDEGGVVLVHASLSSLGWVCGGAVTVAAALLDVLGPVGTLVVPTHTGGNSDPAAWANPPVPQAWWPIVREEMPAFDPRVTPTAGMGALPDVVRTLPGAVRSAHPQSSFAAVGPQAEVITGGHELDSGMGEASPVGRLYDLGGHVLLLGVGHGANSSLHLAEYRVRRPVRHTTASAITTLEGRRWVAYEDVALDSEDFEALGADFDATGGTRVGRVGSAECRLFPQRDAVDFAVGWLERRRV